MSPVRMKWSALALVPIAAFAALTSVRLRSASPVLGEWRAYNGNYASTRYSPLDQINKDTVKNLKVVWRQSLTPDVVKEGREGVPPPPANNETTPLMIGGLVYFSTGIGGVAALDAATGKVVWHVDSPASTPNAPAERRRRSRQRAAARWQRDARPRLLDGRPRRTHRRADRRPVSHRAERQDRQALSRISATAARSICARARSEGRPRSPGAPGRRSSSAASSSSVRWSTTSTARRRSRTRRCRRATSAASTSAPASSCGSGTRFRGPGEVGNETWLEDSWIIHRQHERLGPDERRRRAWLRLSAGDDADQRLVRRAAPGRQSVCREHRRAGCAHGKARVALPGRAPRSLGLRLSRARRCSPTSPSRADASRRSPSRRSRPSSTCSIARTASRCGRSRSVRCRRATCPASGIRRRSPCRSIRTASRSRTTSRACTVDDLIDFTPELRAEAIKILERLRLRPDVLPDRGRRPGQGRRQEGVDAHARHLRRHELAGRGPRSGDKHPVRAVGAHAGCGVSSCRRRQVRTPSWSASGYRVAGGTAGTCRCSSRRTAGWSRSISTRARSSGPSPTAMVRATIRRSRI